MMDTFNETDQYENMIIDSFPTVTPGNETYVFNISLLGPQRDSLFIVIPITIIYAIIFFTGVVGNVSTCIVISRNKSMHTATNYYLFSLAVSDLLLLITGLPQEVYSIWSRYPYVFGELFCVLRGLASETSANATVLTITAFTVERYVAICHPFLSHTMSRLSRAVKFIFGVWLIAFGSALPQALQFGLKLRGPIVCCDVTTIIIKHSFELSTFIFFVTPMILITVLYALIGLRLRTSNMMKRNSGSVRNDMNTSRRSCRNQTGKSSRRVLKMLVAVVVAFFICWAPFHAQRLVAIYGTPNNKLYDIITYISGILYYVSTTVNPILYHIMSNKFREAFKETLGGCWYGQCRRRRRSSSSHLSDRRSCYSVLSRSGGCAGARGSRPNIQQDSTDSGTSVSTCMHPQPLRHANIHINNETLVFGTVECKHKTPYEQFTFDMHQVASLNKLSFENEVKPNRKRSAGFFSMFRCGAQRSFEDNNLQPQTPTQINEFDEQQNSTDQPNHRFRNNSLEISNTSLRDFENGALEDELTIYMQPQTSTQINEFDEQQNTTDQLIDRSRINCHEINDSSLRNCENGALEDELTIFMKEMQCKEKGHS